MLEAREVDFVAISSQHSTEAAKTIIKQASVDPILIPQAKSL
jgi:hypothetical protein